MDVGLITRRETAATLHASPRTLIAWAKLGYGPCPIRLGRRVFYRRSDVAAFVAGEIMDASEAHAQRYQDWFASLPEAEEWEAE